jgi:hypothetical protein
VPPIPRSPICKASVVSMPIEQFLGEMA